MKTKIQRWLLTCLAQGLGATGGVQTTYQSDDGGEESKASMAKGPGYHKGVLAKVVNPTIYTIPLANHLGVIVHHAK